MNLNCFKEFYYSCSELRRVTKALEPTKKPGNCLWRFFSLHIAPIIATFSGQRICADNLRRKAQLEKAQQALFQEVKDTTLKGASVVVGVALLAIGISSVLQKEEFKELYQYRSNWQEVDHHDRSQWQEVFWKQKEEFKELYQYRSNWQEVFRKQKEEIGETLLFLSDYGKLTPIIQKFHDFVGVDRELSKENQKKPLQDLANISDEEMADVHRVGYDLFNKKEYEKAAKVANWLILTNPYEPARWDMLGCALWAQNRMQEALTSFVRAASIKPDVTFYGHVLLCLRKLKYTQEALNYYQLAKQFLTNANKENEISQLDDVIKRL